MVRGMDPRFAVIWTVTRGTDNGPAASETAVEDIRAQEKSDWVSSPGP